MTLRADAQGFLIGELVDTGHESIDLQRSGNRTLGRISTDVSAIARVLGVASRAARLVVEPAGRGSRVARQAQSSGEARAGQVAGGYTKAASARAATIGTPNARATVSPGGRDSKGRFVAGTGKHSKAGLDGGGGDSGFGYGGDGGDGFAKKLGQVIGAATEASSETDSTLIAMKEIKGVVEPLGRGMFAIFGKSEAKKKEGWFKKIWKTLTNIEKKPANTGPGGMPSMDGGDSSIMGGVAGLAARYLPMLLAGLGTALVSVLGVVGAAGFGVYIGGKIYEWLDKSGIATKIFDAFDSVSAWFKSKMDPIKDIPKDFEKGAAEVSRTVGTGSAHRQMENFAPEPVGESKSIAQSLGRAKGHTENFLRENMGFTSVGPGNDPTGSLSRSPEAIAARKKMLVAQMNASGITNKNERAAFWAQAAHESGGFAYMEEKGSRSYLDRMDGRKDLGNVNPGDGARYKGRGFFQLTGRANYRDMGARLGLDLENNPEQAANPEIAARIATEFWKNRSRAKKFGGGKISDLAKAGDIDGVTQGINGGMNGAGHRRAEFNAAFRNASVAGGPAPIQLAAMSSVPSRLPAMPDSQMPTPSSDKERPITVNIRQPLGQEVSDRGIAHVSGGGIGRPRGW